MTTLSACRALLVVIIWCLAAQPTGAGLLDLLGVRSSTNAATAVNSLSGLSEDQLIAALKEALGNGVKKAVSDLGKDGGFLTNVNVKIPMPETLKKVEQTLRAFGQNKLADDFVASMNHAAEKAVPEAAVVFSDSIKQMTIADAKNILNGPTNAATQFFARVTRTNLYGKFQPIVSKATAEVGVTQNYKQMVGKVSGTNSLGGGLLGGLTRNVVDEKSLDLDGYVTSKALDGLFQMVAEEEARIRANPLARTSDLLQKVFGAVAKKP